MAPAVRETQKPKVLDLIDSMVLNLERRRRRAGQLTRLLLVAEQRRMKKFEPYQAARFDRAIVVGQADREAVESLNVETIPLGVSIPKEWLSDYEPHRIIFSGRMGYAANIAAFEWFTKEVLTRLRRSIPDLELVVAGADPTRRVRNLDGIDGIRVTGYVTDLRREIARSALSVAPMQTGSGMQNKVLEAMACGVPVVATTLGKGSIDATDDDGLVVADDPESFAIACERILGSDKLRQTLGLAAREKIRRSYGWDVHRRRVEELYRTLSIESRYGRE